MIIDEIKLNNIGVFYGVNTVKLTPPSPEKNIILFGGMNGAGKTTLLESIQLGLFGRQAAHLKRSIGYEKYIRTVISRSARDGASIEVEFRINLKGKFVAYHLIRTWVIHKERVKEKLEVFVDGIFDGTLSESWEEEVERFLSPRLSHLFFFDGEKIEALANPKTSTKILESAIASLLGVDVVDQVSNDLKLLISRKLKESLPAIDKEQVQDLEGELNTIVQQEKDLKNQRANLRSDLDHALLSFSKSREDYAEKGGHLLELSESLKNKLSTTETLLLSNKLELRQIASGPLPLHLLAQEIGEIKEQVELEGEIKINSILESAYKKRDERIILQLKENNCSNILLNNLTRYLDLDRASLLESKGEIVYDIDDTDMHSMSALVNGQLKDVVVETNRVLAENRILEDKLMAVEKELSRVPDEDQVRGSFLDMKRKEDTKISINNDIQVLNEHLENIVFRKEKLVNRLEKILGNASDMLIENEEQARIIEYSNKVRSVMSDFKVRVIEKHASQLEILIANAFKSLLNKSHLVETIKIDPQGCLLRLYNIKGEEVLARGLSAGERQLLATAILWALGKASGSSLPVVIDTPLGRLDSVHRRHLLERYFPEASHQVILLSTDEEIDIHAEGVLGERVGRHYVLSYNDDLGATSIQEGYFGGKLT